MENLTIRYTLAWEFCDVILSRDCCEGRWLRTTFVFGWLTLNIKTLSRNLKSPLTWISIAVLWAVPFLSAVAYTRRSLCSVETLITIKTYQAHVRCPRFWLPLVPVRVRPHVFADSNLAHASLVNNFPDAHLFHASCPGATPSQTAAVPH